MPDRPNLDELRAELEEQLAEEGLIIFHAFSRMSDVSSSMVHWDTERYPDHRLFLKVAREIGAKIIVYHHREFTTEYVADAVERLEASELSREERRDIERRLRELRAYEGFTCSIELSFDHDDLTYVFDLRTEWYDELLDVLEQIDSSIPDEDDMDDEPMGGYFSRN